MSAGLSDELWVLSTTRMEWTLSMVVGESPSARYGHTMTAVGNNLYLFGGNKCSRKCEDQPSQDDEESESSCDRCCD
jgi:hypothetical protein